MARQAIVYFLRGEQGGRGHCYVRKARMGAVIDIVLHYSCVVSNNFHHDLKITRQNEHTYLT